MSQQHLMVKSNGQVSPYDPDLTQLVKAAPTEGVKDSNN